MSINDLLYELYRVFPIRWYNWKGDDSTLKNNSKRKENFFKIFF